MDQETQFLTALQTPTTVEPSAARHHAARRRRRHAGGPRPAVGTTRRPTTRYGASNLAGSTAGRRRRFVSGDEVGDQPATRRSRRDAPRPVPRGDPEPVDARDRPDQRPAVTALRTGTDAVRAHGRGGQRRDEPLRRARGGPGRPWRGSGSSAKNVEPSELPPDAGTRLNANPASAIAGAVRPGRARSRCPSPRGRASGRRSAPRRRRRPRSAGWAATRRSGR